MIIIENQKKKILNRAKHYIKKHEGELKQSKQAKDLVAKWKVYMERVGLFFTMMIMILSCMMWRAGENRFSIFYHHRIITLMIAITGLMLNFVCLFVCFFSWFIFGSQSINRIKRELANLIVVITPWEMRIKKIESKYNIRNRMEIKWIFVSDFCNVFVSVEKIIECILYDHK